MPNFSARRLSRSILVVLALVFSGCSSVPQAPAPQPAKVNSALLAEEKPKAKLEVHVINVGQADAILIRCPDGTHEMLIDSGDTRYPGSSAKFKAYMDANQQKTNKIEVVVASHPHADHIGNMKWVVENYPIGLYVDSGMKSTTATYKNLMTAIANHQVAHKTAQDAQLPSIAFCPSVKAEILRPQGYGEDEDDPNNVSVVVRLEYKTQKFLFVGDAEEREERLFVLDQTLKDSLNCDFLKVGHHGSNTSSSPDFLELVGPRISAISCGEKGVGTNKQYLHPRASAVTALLAYADPREGPAVTIDAYDSHGSWKKVKLNAAVYVTQKEGDLTFECDGDTIRRK